MQVQGIKNFRKILYFAFCVFNVINSFKYKTKINDLSVTVIPKLISLAKTNVKILLIDRFATSANCR